MKTDELKLLPPPEKRVAAKVLHEAGYSTLKIEDWLGISDSTVLRASYAVVPEQLKAFEAEFKLSIEMSKKRALVMAHERMTKIIPTYKRLDHLVKAAEYFEGKKDQPTTAIQNNNITLSDEQLHRLIEG